MGEVVVFVEVPSGSRTRIRAWIVGVFDTADEKRPEGAQADTQGYGNRADSELVVERARERTQP